MTWVGLREMRQGVIRRLWRTREEGHVDQIDNEVDGEIDEDEFTAVASGSTGQVARGRRTVAPGEGERNAMVGYVGQYQLAAQRTLAALYDGELGRVLLADVRAGQIDDFQIGRPNRVDAHQVKWSRDPGVIGFAAFVNDAAEHVSYSRWCRTSIGTWTLRISTSPAPSTTCASYSMAAAGSLSTGNSASR